MKLGMLVERRYLRQEITEAVVRVFRERAVTVDIVCTQDCHFRPEAGLVRTESGGQFDLRSYDVLISRSRNVLGLAMLGYVDAAGIPAINSYSAVQHTRNKADVALALGAAGVPCAPTILADRAAVLADLPSDWFPLILKATYGDASQGLRVIRSPEDLFDVRWSDELALAQHYVANDGYDLKLYVVGDRVFGMRKPSPLNCDRGAVTMPIVPDADMAAIARRCGQVLGLQIYGVDAIQTDAGSLVIEVNEFPNFTDVPRAADAIADYILDRVMNPPWPILPVPTEHPQDLPGRGAERRRAELKGGPRANRLSGAGV